MVNMFLEDLLINLANEFRIATLDVLLEHTDGGIYLINGKLSYTDDSNADFSTMYNTLNYHLIEYPIINETKTITFAINLDSLVDNEHIKNNRDFVISKIYALIFSIAIIMIIGLFLFATPIITTLKSLMTVIKELGEDYPEDEISLTTLVSMAKFIENNLPKKINYLVYYDETTGLANRKMLKRVYSKFILKGSEFVIILIDIKQFKRVNDIYGEDVGNRVLVDITHKLQQLFASVSAEFIRYSGDEFIVMFDKDKVGGKVEDFYNLRVCEVFDKPLIYPDTKPIKIDLNAVAIVNPQITDTDDETVKKLYIMLKEKKSISTSVGLLVFNNELYNRYIKEERIKDCLKNAIETNEFVINYQPIVNGDKQICKAEALIRWFSKDLGFVPPNEFIYVAEQTRMIIDLGNWIMDRVAQDLKTLCDEGRPVQMSVNASPIQIMEQDFVQNVVTIFGRYGIDYKYVCIEITESILLEEQDIVRENIKKLQKLGIAVALDDFGTGYSSFSYLKEYNLDILKIDKIFVDSTTAKDYAIIDVMSRIAHILDMQVVLEGVETEEQFNNLHQFGLIQGYYFSRPVRWDEFVQLL
nr:MAG: hypothetical protein ATN33_08040 [Epulopiscium sp. Nele67-Bin001]